MLTSMQKDSDQIDHKPRILMNRVGYEQINNWMMIIIQMIILKDYLFVIDFVVNGMVIPKLLLFGNWYRFMSLFTI